MRGCGGGGAGWEGSGHRGAACQHSCLGFPSPQLPAPRGHTPQHSAALVLPPWRLQLPPSTFPQVGQRQLTRTYAASLAPGGSRRASSSTSPAPLRPTSQAVCAARAASRPASSSLPLDSPSLSLSLLLLSGRVAAVMWSDTSIAFSRLGGRPLAWWVLAGGGAGGWLAGAGLVGAGGRRPLLATSWPAASLAAVPPCWLRCCCCCLPLVAAVVAAGRGLTDLVEGSAVPRLLPPVCEELFCLGREVAGLSLGSCQASLPSASFWRNHSSFSSVICRPERARRSRAGGAASPAPLAACPASPSSPAIAAGYGGATVRCAAADCWAKGAARRRLPSQAAGCGARPGAQGLGRAFAEP